MIFNLNLKISLMLIMYFTIPGEAICTKKTDLKWLKMDGKVTVRYAFHKNLENDTVIRNLVHQAAQVLKEKTCVEWNETLANDTCHKVIFMRGDKCVTNMGPHIGLTIGLAIRCYKLAIILHEMLHTLGIWHTNQRPDRDEYVQTWTSNIKQGHEGNFRIKRYFETYDVPYDYQSIMHYGRFYFNKNNLYTTTSTDSQAMLAMGNREDTLRWSDAAMVNRHLDCVADFSTCGWVSNLCKNNGYLLNECKCVCPENLNGDYCQLLIRDSLYDEKVTCGGLIERDTTISIKNAHLSKAKGNLCVFQMVAKPCYRVQVTFKTIDMPGSECSDNVLAFEIPGSLRTYCNINSAPSGLVVVFSQRTVAIHYYLGKAFPNKNAGFKADVTFQKNTTWPDGKEISDTLGDCFRRSFWDYYLMRTPHYPSTVGCFAECSETFEVDIEGNETGFMRLELDQKLKATDELTIEDRHFIWTIKSSSKPSLAISVQIPVIVKFHGGDDPGKGFEFYIYQGHARICDGKTMSVNRSGLVIMNPIYDDHHRINCYINIEASTGNRLYFNLKGTMDDTVYIGTKQSVKDKDYNLHSYSDSPENVYVNEHSALLYYTPEKTRKNWKIIVTLQECYFKPDGLCM